MTVDGIFGRRESMMMNSMTSEYTTAQADVASSCAQETSSGALQLDELVGSATNTALLPAPNKHAFDDLATGEQDPLMLGGHAFSSRFILGSGRYDLSLIEAAIENAGTQIITMALRRCRTAENNLLDYIPDGITLLPNTSGAHDAGEAVRIARLAREVCGTDFIKVEIEHESRYLLPDNAETIKATEILAAEGFVVMPYMLPDPLAATQLEDAGAACVMPLGSLIGSNKGLGARDLIEVIITNASVPVIIDAGIGRPSQAAQAMEMGADAIMAYTAIASARNIPVMARAFKHAVQAGREAYLAGLGIVTHGHAVASSPTEESDYLGASSAS
jgi:thiazole synthase